jgi:N-acetylneuraminic acid mutarotase
MKNLGKIIPAASILIALSAFSACEKKQEPIPEPVTTVKWAWVAGSKTINQAGAYGTKGVPSAANVPGAREDATGWVDAGDELWLFGGFGYDSTGFPGRMNDLWTFDPAAGTWSWVAGANIRNQAGIYGTIGLPDPVSTPGARNGAVSWIDASGRLWLFGGLAYDAAGAIGQINDLWSFDPATVQWTWAGGSSTRYASGVYGTVGVADPANVPGARVGASARLDASGNLWLFGGFGYDAEGEKGRLNDLWKFDPATLLWTWISGSDAIDQIGTYGTLGEPDPANVPGARFETVSWIDASGAFWLFGGDGLDFAGTIFKLNDLWKFDPATVEWTWVDGSKFPGSAGVYGTLNTPAATNIPGARSGSVTWLDANGLLWLCGGYGLDSTTDEGWLNDLFRYDPETSDWTWMGGYPLHGQKGVYGTLGTGSTANIAGARYFAISWIDSQGVRWLFGGYGLDSEGVAGWLNDLWRQDLAQ